MLLMWASPALPGARHDAVAARECKIPDTLAAAVITAFAETACHGCGHHQDSAPQDQNTTDHPKVRPHQSFHRL
jgi:Zn ribbon nucleic-acid-binding protein